MPTAFVTRYECDRNLFPPVCACCAAPADGCVLIRVPSVAMNAIMASCLILCPPLFLVMMIVARRVPSARVPMCEPHQADWNWRDRVTTWTYLLVVGGSYVAAPVLSVALLPTADELCLALGFLVYYLVWVAWLMPTAVLWTRTVRSSKVTPRGIRLSGVHAEFVRALNEDRARDRDPQRHALYGDVRDDFDEEPV